MQEKPSNSKRVKPLKLLLAIGIIAVAVLAFYFPNYARLCSLRRANQKLRSDIGRLEAEIGDLENKIERVESDPLLYEKLAREELGVAKEDEIVVDIEE